LLASITLLAFVLQGQQAQAARARQLQTVTISMGYVPNFQFAPFYVAVSKGYYAAAGININFDYAQTSDVIKLVGTGKVAFGNAEADQVIVGAANSLPLISVFTQYQRFPVVIATLANSGIHSFADLKGRSIGIPALYGASYTGLIAALDAAHLSTNDVKIDVIGYTQVAELATHHVDAVVVYAMNEVVQLREQGFKLTVLPIATEVPIGGPGVIASQDELAKNAGLVRGFVQATWRGLRDTIAGPAAALAISLKFMPGIPSSQLPTQLAQLEAAIPYWTPPLGRGIGCASAASWQATEEVLLAQKQITHPVDVTPLFTNRFLAHC